jgi:hydroxymethylbilane synthase
MTPGAALRVGTRGSALALWQTERVRGLLQAGGVATTRVEIRTTGDAVPDVALSRIGARGLFTRQIDEALLDGRIDLAVHSLKDLPTVLPTGIALAAVGERDDPRDALVGRTRLAWAGIPPGATLATSSLRRRAQLLHTRPDLQVADIRGNVDTRLAKLEAQAEWTGIVLATAGLTRLGLADRIGERLPFDLMLPAPGQGALAVTAREGDDRAAGVACAALHHFATARATGAERAFLRRLEGGCQVPVAAYGGVSDTGAGRRLGLHGRVISLDGERMVEGRMEGEATDEAAAAALGTALAERLLGEGAAEILAEVRTVMAPEVTGP